MRLIFFGTPDFASRCLRKILSSSHEVAAVVTAPDRPRGRGRKLSQPDVKKLALEHKLEILQPDSLKDRDFLERLDSINADFYCVVAFRILPEVVYEKPASGCVNLHASLLPRYRGAAPINWALINGETQTGLTTFFIRRRVDTGDIILQREIDIGPEETFGELHDRMAEAGGDLLIETMDLIERGKFETTVQDDAQATAAPKIYLEMGIIDWTLPANAIHNLIRGLSPRPGAYSYLGEKRLTILRSRLSEESETGGSPGTIVTADPKRGISVCCGEASLDLLMVKPESGKPVSAADYVKGYRLRSGDSFADKRASSDFEV